MPTLSKAEKRLKRGPSAFRAWLVRNKTTIFYDEQASRSCPISKYLNTSVGFYSISVDDKAITLPKWCSDLPQTFDTAWSGQPGDFSTEQALTTFDKHQAALRK